MTALVEALAVAVVMALVAEPVEEALVAFLAAVVLVPVRDQPSLVPVATLARRSSLNTSSVKQPSSSLATGDEPKPLLPIAHTRRMYIFS